MKPEQEHTPPKPPRRGALGDPVVRVGIVLWLLSLLPSLAPILPPAVTLEWADIYSDVPILLLLLYATLRAVRVAAGARERSFWRLVAGMVVAFLAVRGVYAVVPLDLWGTGVDLTTDVLYLAGYLCLAFGIERRPDRNPGQGAEARLQQVETLGVLVFAFGLLTYFVLIPSVFNPEVYASWVSSLLFYAVLDLYLLIRCAGLLRAEPGPGWVGPYRWLMAVFALWLLGDVTEGLIYLGTLPWVDPGTPADTLWMLPSLLLLLAVRSRGRPAAPTGAGRGGHATLGGSGGTSVLAALGLGIPAIHFLLLGLHLGDPASEHARELLIFVLLVALASLLAVRHRLVHELTASLEADRNLAASQLAMARRMEAIGRMAAGVAHDFSNLLSVVRGRGDLLVSGTGAYPALHADARAVVDAARRGEALAARLMAFGQARDEESPTVALDEVLVGLRPLLGRILPESVDLRVDTAVRDVLVNVDRVQLEQVALNLVLNARDAMEGRGRVRITIDLVDPDDTFVAAHGGERAGPYALLRVADDGPGIPPELRHAVFEPFFTTKTREEGTGLGLSIVYGIVRQAGGFVRLAEAAEGGTVVELFLPLAAGAASPSRLEDPEATPARDIRDGGTILLLEDYDALRATCARVLEEAGYRVIQAATSAHALAILERRHEVIDLVVADLVLPDHAGYDLHDKIIARRPDVPVLFMTGYPEGVTPLRSPDAPPLLEKPFAPSALLRAVREALTGPSRASG